MVHPTDLTPVNRLTTRVAILANPWAGARDCHRRVDELVVALRLRNLQPELCWQREEFSAFARENRDYLRGVVAAGGDGTLCEVLNRAPGLPVAILPAGNENLLARHLRQENSAVAVADRLAGGQIRRLDLARVNGRLFSLMASAGFDAGVVRRVSARRSGHIHRLSYALPIWETMQSYRFPPIEVVVEDTGERLRGAMVFVFNLPEYALRLPLGADAVADDGLLNLYVFERRGLGNLLRALSMIVPGRQTRLPGFQQRLVRRVSLSAAEPVPLQTDGDFAGELPVTIEIVPGALPLLVSDCWSSALQPERMGQESPGHRPGF